MGRLATIPVLFLVVAVALVAAFGAVAWRGLGPFGSASRRNGNTQNDQKTRHRAGVGCPVMLTSGQDFTGAAFCLQVGRHESLPSLGGNGAQAFAFREGVRSVEVRPGYRVVLYPAPALQGVELFERRAIDAPSRYVAYSKADALSPASALVSLVRGAAT